MSLDYSILDLCRIQKNDLMDFAAAKDGSGRNFGPTHVDL